MKIANRDARKYVQSKHPFQGSHLYGEFFCSNPSDISEGQCGYVVYSYGPHHPLLVAVHIDGQDHWFANEDGYSQSTKRHMSQCRPDIYTDADITLNWLSTEWMKVLVHKGYRGLVKARILQGVQV